MSPLVFLSSSSLQEVRLRYMCEERLGFQTPLDRVSYTEQRSSVLNGAESAQSSED